MRDRQSSIDVAFQCSWIYFCAKVRWLLYYNYQNMNAFYHLLHLEFRIALFFKLPPLQNHNWMLSVWPFLYEIWHFSCQKNSHMYGKWDMTILETLPQGRHAVSPISWSWRLVQSLFCGRYAIPNMSGPLPEAMLLMFLLYSFTGTCIHLLQYCHSVFQILISICQKQYTTLKYNKAISVLWTAKLHVISCLAGTLMFEVRWGEMEFHAER